MISGMFDVQSLLRCVELKTMAERVHVHEAVIHTARIFKSNESTMQDIDTDEVKTLRR